MSVRIVTATLTASCLVAAVPAVLAAGAAAAATTDGARALCGPSADTVGPSISSVVFSRSSIDLGSGSRTETVTVHASDTSGSGDPSGVARVGIFINDHGLDAAPTFRLVSGTPASGTWRAGFTVPTYSHVGEYTLADLDATDAAGNQQDYPSYGVPPQGPNALSLHPADNPTFSVTGVSSPKARAGSLRSFSLSRTHVNTTASSASVHVDAQFTSTRPSQVTAYLRSAGKAGRYVNLRGALHRQGHRWTGSVRVPRWIGRQKLTTSLYAQWPRGVNPERRSYDNTAIKHFDHRSHLDVVSGVDRSAPSLTSLTASHVDASTDAGHVTYTARAADHVSGVSTIFVHAQILDGANGVTAGRYPYTDENGDPIGYTSSHEFRVALHKTSKGTWVGTGLVRQCVPSGTYQLDVTERDRAGNVRTYHGNQLTKAGLARTIHVTSRRGDDQEPYVRTFDPGHDGQLGLNFSEGVTHVNASTLRVYAHPDYRSPLTVTGIVCSNGTQPVDCSGSDGPVLSAVLSVPDLSASDTPVVYANQDQVFPQLADANDNPMDWNVEQY